MSKIEDIDIINYMINNETTAKETAEYFGVSLSTIKKRLSGIKSELQDSSIIKENLNNLSIINQNNGRVKGGKVLGSGVTLTENLETIVARAKEILANNLTIEEASKLFKIPSSTLAEHLKLLKNTEYKEVYNDLQTLFEYHKRHKGSSYDASLFNLQQKYSISLEFLENQKKSI